MMANSIIDWKHCLHGGIPGSNGHSVHASQMTTMHVGKVTIRICVDCKARKMGNRKKERLAHGR